MNNYTFNPEDFLGRPDEKRLSTCALKYRDDPYCMSSRQFYASILKVCPHIIRTKYSNLGYLFDGNAMEKRGWLNENCKGYWYDTTDMYFDHRKTVNTAKVIYLFEHLNDALQFKLVWGGN